MPTRSVRHRIAHPVAVLLLAWLGHAVADVGDAASVAPPAGPTPVAVASVVVDGRTLMALRGLSALPAEKRAADVAARIEAAASDPRMPADALRLVEGEDRTSIVAGDASLVSVFDADAHVEGTGNRQLVAEVYRTRIVEAITAYRTERGSPFLGRQALAAMATLAAMALLLALVHFATKRLLAAARRRLGSRLEEVEARAFSLLTAEQLDRTVERLIRAVRWLLAFAIVFIGFDYLLALFPWTRFTAVRAAALMIDPLRTMWNGLVDAVPGLVFVIVLVVVTRYVLRLLQVFFGNVANGRVRIDGFAVQWSWPTYRLVRVAVVAFAVVIAYPYIPGSASDAFKGVSIFFGLLMSLGAASAVANSLAGYTLIYRRTFEVGDRIRVGDVTGDVVEMRQQVTHLKTVKNEIVTIPSSTLLTSQVTNYSSLARDTGVILHTTVGIGYETPWRQVEAMLLLAASRTEGLQRKPAPYVLQKQLGDFAVVYEINAYCTNAQAMDITYTALHRNILDVFNEFEVAIMTPAYVADPADAKLVPRGQWYKPPAVARAPQSPDGTPSQP